MGRHHGTQHALLVFLFHLPCFLSCLGVLLSVGLDCSLLCLCLAGIRNLQPLVAILDMYSSRGSLSLLRSYDGTAVAEPLGYTSGIA